MSGQIEVMQLSLSVGRVDGRKQKLVKIHRGKHRMAMEEKWFGHEVLGARVNKAVMPTSLSF